MERLDDFDTKLARHSWFTGGHVDEPIYVDDELANAQALARTLTKDAPPGSWRIKAEQRHGGKTANYFTILVNQRSILRVTREGPEKVMDTYTELLRPGIAIEVFNRRWRDILITPIRYPARIEYRAAMLSADGFAPIRQGSVVDVGTKENAALDFTLVAGQSVTFTFDPFTPRTALGVVAPPTPVPAGTTIINLPVAPSNIRLDSRDANLRPLRYRVNSTNVEDTLEIDSGNGFENLDDLTDLIFLESPAGAANPDRFQLEVW
jgi:hypothetical protein